MYRRESIHGDKIVLMGDSHALMWLPPVKRSATREGWRLVALLRGGCEPTLGTQNIGQYGIDRGASCRAWRQGTVDWLNGHPPDLIVIVCGALLGLELKTPVGRQSEDQKRVERAWAEAGARYAIVRSVTDARIHVARAALPQYGSRHRVALLDALGVD